MTSRDFCFWLQGFFEINHVHNINMPLSPQQVDTVRRHLALVFMHEIDPAMGDQPHQAALNQVHGGTGSAVAGKLGGIGPNGEVMRC